MTDNKIVNQALEVLRNGGTIVYPTDTIWGIGCDATNPLAVAKIYRIKQREECKAMIVLMDSIQSVAKYVHTLPPIACELLEAATESSPLTLILPNAIGVAENLLPDQKTIAIRIPNHQFCMELLGRFGRPIVSTSANISAQPAPTKFVDIAPQILDAVDFVVDKSQEGSPTGKPSSIIKLEADGQFQIIR